jgi:hypothetical protein
MKQLGQINEMSCPFTCMDTANSGNQMCFGKANGRIYMLSYVIDHDKVFDDDKGPA